MSKINFFEEEEVTVYLDSTIYSKDSIFKCLYWYGDKYYTSFFKDADNYYVVKLKSKSSEFEAEKILLMLEKDLIDFNLRDIVTKETSNIRDLLIAKAFSHGEFDELPFGEISDPVGFEPENV